MTNAEVFNANVGDMISRRAAIKEIARWSGYLDEDMIFRIQTGLEKLPSAQRKGKWLEEKVIPVYENGFPLQSCKCSECGRYDTRPYMYFFDEPRFCSYCGVEMVKGESDDERTSG